MERGFNLISYGNDAYASSETKKALNDLRALGANAVTFTTSYSMSSKTASDIETWKYTASDSALATGIEWARQLGMRTTIALYVDLVDASWRARIQPADRDLWFSQYSAILNHLADLSQQNKVDHLCIGVELISMTTATSNPDNTGRWLAMIQGVRERYHGGVIYAANWGGSLGFGDEYSHIQFWNAVDEVGIDAYYPLTPHVLPTLTELEHSWGQIHDTILLPFARQVQRPIVFTEVGYRSVEGDAIAPSFTPPGTPYASCGQAQAYFALLDSWKASKLLGGIQWWYWSTASDALKPQETSYSPRGKPAATVVAAFWGGKSIFSIQALGKLLKQCRAGY